MKQNIFIAILIMMRFISPITADLSYIGLMIFAFQGRIQSIQALLLCWFITMANPELVAASSLSGAGRYLVFLAVALVAVLKSSILRGKVRLDKQVKYVLFISCLLVINSIIASPIMDVSLLKAVSWCMVVTSLYAHFISLTKEERLFVERWIYSFFVIILVASVPLIVTSYGYIKNTTGFNGVMNHPQVLGPLMAILGAWTLSDFLQGKRKLLHSLLILGATLLLVLMSEARTAGLAMVLGLVLSMLVVVFHGSRIKHVLPVLLTRRTLAIVWLLITVSIAFSSYLIDGMQHYISKSGRSEASSLLEAYDRSRGRLIEQMKVNISENPWFGIGFGIASDASEMNIRRDQLTGLSIGAAVEKGVMPLAVLEELGVFVFLIIMYWLFTLLKAARQRNFLSIYILFVCLLINMGESIFFSPGGQGLLVLILVACFTANTKHQVSENVENKT